MINLEIIWSAVRIFLDTGAGLEEDLVTLVEYIFILRNIVPTFGK